ncbi:MarR family winged helix-turn-helix transcriptional regulator [Streptomyces sp. WMMB303]|uniref:MarR family winged helix-turn-helix transcriptional regulator n=1 Tax=Streptomyces sp. WMMB303 TaxID=3034154 RepID=UPI0023EAB2D4|nr:MarR family winged helix-turn-helix transcriptional regulator [Streptomyces sp. WMMB303]MDF4251076.1 MarR family winged helix-turn-helix transcriptional regulator [Streptomyces sp. WMMB303]
MTGTRWLDEREMAAWQGFLEATSRVSRHLEQQLKEDAGLSHPHYEILVRLAAAPDGEVRMTDLAEGLFTSKSGLTYQVGQLEKRGLVERHSCPTDVRGVLAALTPEGRGVLRAAAPGHVAAVRAALIDVLEPDELDVVARALGRVGQRLRPPDQGAGSSDSGGISTSSS